MSDILQFAAQYGIIDRVSVNAQTQRSEHHSVNNKHTSYKVALGGVICALSLALMFLTGVFPLLNFAIPIYAGALMIVMAHEVSAGWAAAAYCAVSILSLFLTPDKEASTLFIMFFGYYPILLPFFKKIRPRFIVPVIKFAMYNACMFTWYKMITFVLGIYDFFGNFHFLGKYFVVGVLIFINLIFLLYDYTIEAIEEVYVEWFRPTYFGKKPPKQNTENN